MDSRMELCFTIEQTETRATFEDTHKDIVGISESAAYRLIGKTITNKKEQTFKVVGYQQEYLSMSNFYWVVFGEWNRREYTSYMTRVNDIIEVKNENH